VDQPSAHAAAPRQRIFTSRTDREVKQLRGLQLPGSSLQVFQVGSREDPRFDIKVIFEPAYFASRGVDRVSEPLCFWIHLPSSYPFQVPLVTCDSLAWSFSALSPDHLWLKILPDEWTPSATMEMVVGKIRELADDQGVCEAKGQGVLEIPWTGWVVLGAVVARLAVGLGGHSGFGTPPMYGDFEAQRHWKEITVNLPIGDWYFSTDDNDLLYWGLDYPPLTAYHSWAVGKIFQLIVPDAVSLFSSRGFGSNDATAWFRHWMRCSALLSDSLVFVPALVFFCFRGLLVAEGVGQRWRSRCFCLAVFCPPFLLIDHGHFQYNCVALGLVLWTVNFASCRRPLLAALCFSCALLYKQTMLYFAPAVFAYLLGKSWWTTVEENDRVHRRFAGVRAVLQSVLCLGCVTILTFSVVLAPIVFCTSSGSVISVSAAQRAAQLFRRVFPVDRGIYEDFVANFWVLTSPVLKLRHAAASGQSSKQFWLMTSTVTTLLAFLPACVDLFFHPTRRRFMMSLAQTSLAFFLFSWQVHEKAILLPLLPIVLCVPFLGGACLTFGLVASFSLLPLLEKDGLTVQAMASTMAWLGVACVVAGRFGFMSYAGSSFYHLIFKGKVWILVSCNMLATFCHSIPGADLMLLRGRSAGGMWVPFPEAVESLTRTHPTPSCYWFVLSLPVATCACVVLVLARVAFAPPKQFPHLHTYANSAFSCLVFASSFVILFGAQRRQPKFDNLSSSEMKTKDL